MVPRLQDSGNVVLSQLDLQRLLESVVPEVELHPRSGLDLETDYWIAVLPELGLEYVDLGVDAALIGLANLVPGIVADRLAREGHGKDDRILFLRLWLAHRTHTLGPLLQSGARRYGWDYEEMVAQEASGTA